MLKQIKEIFLSSLPEALGSILSVTFLTLIGLIWKRIYQQSSTNKEKIKLILILLFLLSITVVFISYISRIQPFLQEVLSIKVEVTVLTIAITILLVLGLAIIQLPFARKRRLEARKHEQTIKAELAERDQQIADLEGQLVNQEQLLNNQKANLDILNAQTREINELQDKLREQAVFKESLISSHNSLISKYGLGIIFATYGVDGKETKNVTWKVVSELEEKGKVFIDNDLVGGDKYDPAYSIPKESEVVYYLGKPFSKKVPEKSKLSIEDLIQNSKDNKSEGPRDFGSTQESKWKT